MALADVILLNKVDTAIEEQLPKTLEMIQGINPHARIFTGQKGRFPVERLLEIGTTRPETVEKAKVAHHHHEHGHHEKNSHKITTFTLTFSDPLDLNSLQLDLNRIVHLYRDQVYRVKGYIAIPYYPNRVILQSARSTFIATDGSPWEHPDQREGKLVFIGWDLKKKVFEKMFKRHIVDDNIFNHASL